MKYLLTVLLISGVILGLAVHFVPPIAQREAEKTKQSFIDSARRDAEKMVAEDAAKKAAKVVPYSEPVWRNLVLKKQADCTEKLEKSPLASCYVNMRELFLDHFGVQSYSHLRQAIMLVPTFVAEAESTDKQAAFNK